MSFDADWLELRRPADERARGESTEALLGALLGGPLRIVDLACGSGNNARYLAGKLGPRPVSWQLVDSDQGLLERAAGSLPESTAAETRAADLGSTALAPLFEGADLVTTSAFLDLAGDRWIDAFARGLDEARVPLALAALSVDGQVRWDPPLPEDDDFGAAFHGDMGRDKGLGPALGPDGGARFADAMGVRGYGVQVFDSTWLLEAPRDAELMELYLEGYAEAVLRRRERGRVMKWLGARRPGGGQALRSVAVGHLDVLCVRR